MGFPTYTGEQSTVDPAASQLPPYYFDVIGAGGTPTDSLGNPIGPTAPTAPTGADPNAPANPWDRVPTGQFGDENIKQWLFDYTSAITDPRINQQLILAEQRYRPEYTQLQLQDLENTYFGLDGQEGTLGLMSRMMPEITRMQTQAMSSQREADIADVEALGARATEAFRASDPLRQRAIERQTGLAEELYGRAFQLTPEQERAAQQSAREAMSARGRLDDNASIFAEAMGREEYKRANRMEAMGAGQQEFGMLSSFSADPYKAILGRGSGAMASAQQQQMFGGGLLGSQGPSIYDPNAGVNVGLQQQANFMNYNAALAGATSAEKAGKMEAGAAIGGAAITGAVMLI